jgi:hypothetical protein
MSPSLPTDHDDDHGRTLRRFALAMWYRNWFRAPPSLGNHNRWWIAAKPVTDAPYTTPVIYLAFDRLGSRIRKLRPCSSRTPVAVERS